MVVRSKPLRITLFVSVALLILLSAAILALVLLFDRIFLQILGKKLAIGPDSLVFPEWKSPSLPIYFSVHLYNLTNPDAFKAGSPPQLDIVGPFVYLEKRERYNILFLNDTQPSTVRFDHRIFYYFVPEMSIGDPKDYMITTPDLLVAGSATGLGQFFVSQDRDKFITKTAQGVMWGYRHEAFDESFVLSFSRQPIGLFTRINGTEIFNFLINTGADNIKDIGRIYEVDGKIKMNVWSQDEADMINGTDGSLAPPGLDIGSTIEMHAPSICRSSTLYAVDKKPTRNHDGVEVVVFSPTPAVETQLTRWRSKMFCSSTCPPKGLIALDPCLTVRHQSIPLFLSQPYFLGADPGIPAQFKGLPEPNPIDHSTWVHIEPTAGLVLEAFKRIQFNLQMNLAYGNKPETYYFPLAWIAETAVADRGKLDMIYNKMIVPRKRIPFFLTIAGSICAGLSVVLILVLIFCVRTRSSSHRAKRDGTVSPTSTTKLDKTVPDSIVSDPQVTDNLLMHPPSNGGDSPHAHLVP